MKKRSRAFRLSASSLTMSVLFIAAVIVLNAVFSALAYSRLWYIDMTSDKVFSLSDETIELLSDVKSDVNIYFTQDADKLMSGRDSNEYMKYIYQTALQLEKEFSNIHVKCVDVVKDPAFFEYYYNTAATSIKTTSVIVESGGEFRLLASDAFFVWKDDYSEIWAYDGEGKFAASILQVTAAEMPKVYFTTGHGERSLDKSDALVKLYEKAGYEVGTVDLLKDELDEDARILVINDPVYDFSGFEAGEGVNEIDKIDAFVDDYGCLMVFASPENAGNLTNISEYLYEWGVEFRPGVTVNDKTNSVSRDGRAIVADYETEDTLGASLYSDITGLSSAPKTILDDAMPLSLVYGNDDSTLGAVRVASPVLYSSESAVVLENGEESDGAALPLMTISREETIKENDYFYSYVLVCGSPEFASDTYLNSNSYANGDILLNTVRYTGREKVVANIDIKVLDETELDITTSQANTWSVITVIVPAAAVAVIGAVVCIRRRRT